MLTDNSQSQSQQSEAGQPPPEAVAAVDIIQRYESKPSNQDAEGYDELKEALIAHHNENLEQE